LNGDWSFFGGNEQKGEVERKHQLWGETIEKNWEVVRKNQLELELGMGMGMGMVKKMVVDYAVV
jgi:hypothetical protein